MGATNSQFPERDRDSVTYAQFSGLRNDVSPERFELGDLVAADNIDIDKTGRIARRAGFTSLLAIDAHSLWADEHQDVCLFVASGMLRRLNTDFTATALTTLWDGVSPVSYERVNDRVYFTNGSDKGIFEAGAVRTWGLPTAPLPAAAATVGAMPAGIYQYAMTWLRADGQEGGCGVAGRIELAAGSGIDFTFPAAPPEAVRACLYLTAPNGDVLREAQTAAPGSTVRWQRDPSELAHTLTTQFLSPPLAGQLVAYYRGHLFVAIDDTIFMSSAYGYELFDLRRYLQLDGRITLLAPMTDKERNVPGGDSSGFFVGTERSMGVMAGTDPDNFQYVPKVAYGAVPGTLQYVDGSLVRDGGSGARMLPMWLSAKGVCLGAPDLQINNLTRARFDFDAGGRGAAVFLPNPNRLIVTSNL